MRLVTAQNLYIYNKIHTKHRARGALPNQAAPPCERSCLLFSAACAARRKEIKRNCYCQSASQSFSITRSRLLSCATLAFDTNKKESVDHSRMRDVTEIDREISKRPQVGFGYMMEKWRLLTTLLGCEKVDLCVPCVDLNGCKIVAVYFVQLKRKTSLQKIWL